MRPPGRATRVSWCAAASRIGREHNADSGQNGIEGLVREGKILGIGHFRGEDQPVGVRPASGPVEQALHVIGGDDLASAASGGQCGVAVTGGDVKDLPAGRHVDRLAQPLSHQLQRGADHGVVARGPRGVLLLLDCGQGIGGQGLAHVLLLFAPPLGSLAGRARIG